MKGFGDNGFFFTVAFSHPGEPQCRSRAVLVSPRWKGGVLREPLRNTAGGGGCFRCIHLT